ncbi:MAG: arsenosugar biosynthesis radical SAM protein ArsS [Candidatus Thiodiazotropha lotti]|uniref:Arsenosugar biosynthesis radical SAM protein ArsS n=1 Tax=Candidatus Thiodiazotropha lotti TaxID=2792787 RepID=A0A9E4K5L8_9GAMM|nr:arsenosugar biosynthesis radical SAM protein ArsS [Candidatus Thiodiazotropha lotti]MCG7922690.1 arsenosugar biosynthesis radical SAM protein ArsS [Candidatus Thiodiazotropha lotti]MCG7932657.1 arsenosugar biosynthesis radical SAM protein ArsS [Candidatus Thiodiazotropha lotti]MCG7939972.1 arsenosugar biosynthesis radical SAM protein ArsS [Candidatus Thiodiazotropha lotti]MCG7988158.1 arsenosugar biosynthesis radical SAM protein ArsS [Candidatus Thiodiazotropha lotti]
MLDTVHLLHPSTFPNIQRERLETLQVNLGFLCNLSCVHCHVNAGPKRTELMSRETVDDVLRFLRSHGLKRLDLTGGAPEMNPHFRYLVEQARAMDVHVIDRSNLVIMQQEGYQDLPEFLAAHQVEVVASLPCYLEENVDQQRGKGSYGQSIKSLKKLNSLGYGLSDSKLTLNLVYNPQGPSLPPPQEPLQADYQRELEQRFGVHFNQLFTITNMPIQRFGSLLQSKGQFGEYMTLLRGAYQADNLQSVMCRTLLSVDWQGYLYDCDFNQMLKIHLKTDNSFKPHLRDLFELDLHGFDIQVAEHCYGCTAGQGSSCGGALGD